MMALFASLHFLRPEWFWALLALPPLLWLWRLRVRRNDVWRSMVDPHLLDHLLDARTSRRSLVGPLLASCTWLLAVLAMAGPSWRSGEAPLVQGERALVVAFDLSSAMLAGDLPPARLMHARAKLASLLAERDGGEVGLIAYADDAFTVAPLTGDADNVALFIDALAPDIMPRDGLRADRAIDAAVELLRNAGHAEGDILLLTGQTDVEANAAASRAQSAGYRVSALGFGTSSGAAYRDREGHIAHARLDAEALHALASAGGGAYADTTADGSDLQSLDVLDPAATRATQRAAQGLASRLDEGYWLLPVLIVLAAFAFRRGAVFVVLLALMLPMQVRADDGGTWWKRADQSAHARMREGITAWRKGRHEDALKAWDGLPGADAAYNRGNALATLGRYEEALAAYDEALREQPDRRDARENRAAVEQAMTDEPPQSEEQPSDDGQEPSAPEQGEQQGDGEQQEQPPEPAQGSQDGAGDGEQAPQPPEQAAGEEAAQREAEQVQRERMQRELEQRRQDEDGEEREVAVPRPDEVDASERRQAGDALLRRIPDDPGGLLRARFRLEQERRK